MTSSTGGGLTYNVTPDYVQDAASSCTKTAGEIQTQLATLRSYVVSLEDSWKGIAANQFQTLMQEYDTYSAQLHNALTDIAAGLTSTATNYGDAESASYNNVSGINIPTANLS